MHTCTVQYWCIQKSKFVVTKVSHKVHVYEADLIYYKEREGDEGKD